MSSANHTPWEITADPTEYSLKAIKGMYEYEPNEFASIWIARELSEENAKLIAAAPEMFDIIKEIYDWSIANNTKGRIFSKLESVIKKATA